MMGRMSSSEKWPREEKVGVKEFSPKLNECWQCA